MNELIWIIIGGVLVFAMERIIERAWQGPERAARQNKAKSVLKKFGLTPHLYLPTSGVDDAELRDALDTFAFSGHIITNSAGEVVGKIIPSAGKYHPWLHSLCFGSLKI